MLVSVAYCKLVFLCFVGVHFCVNVILQGYISVCNLSQPTRKATGCEILFYVVLYTSRRWYISQKKQVAYKLV